MCRTCRWVTWRTLKLATRRLCSLRLSQYIKLNRNSFLFLNIHLFSKPADFYFEHLLSEVCFLILGLILNCSSTRNRRLLILSRSVIFKASELISAGAGLTCPVLSTGGGGRSEPEVQERAVGRAGRYLLSPHEDTVRFCGLNHLPGQLPECQHLGHFSVFLQCAGQTDGGEIDPHTKIPAGDHHRGPWIRCAVLRLSIGT